MRTLIGCVMLSLSLGGCAGSIVGDRIAGPEKLAQADDAYCQSIGLQFGTTDYANCREAATARREGRHARGMALVARGAELAATPPATNANRMSDCGDANGVQLTMSDAQAGMVLGIAVYIIGILTALCGILVVGYQGILWLQDGVWTPFSMREVISILGWSSPIPDPMIPWYGIRKIIIWMLDASLSFGMFLVGAATAIAGLNIMGIAQEG